MLLLGSDGPAVFREIPNVLHKSAHSIRLLYVSTATKVARNLTFLGPVEECLADMQFRLERFDIEGKTEQEIDAALAPCDAVYVEGGSLFYLLKAVRESGFASSIRRFLQTGKLYAGASAGAYLACPTIEMNTWKKPGEEHPRYGVQDLTGMNLVPFLIKTHYTPEKEPEVRKGMAATSLPLRILQDGQALLVNDDGHVEFLGEGEEIKL